MKRKINEKYKERWGWVEPSVWFQDRLHRFLENNPDQWDDLYQFIYHPTNLIAAFKKVKANKGGPGNDTITVQEFEENLTRNLEELSEEIRNRTYKPGLLKIVRIPKTHRKDAYRELRIPTIRDRIVQTALCHVIEPIFEKDFLPSSYGFRPRKNCQQAILRLLHFRQLGYNYVLDADIQNYYDTIPQTRLIERVNEKITDPHTLNLIHLLLVQGINSLHPHTLCGIPQGSCIGPLLANIFLHPLDVLLTKSGLHPIRYADDIIVLCTSCADALRAKELVKEWLGTESAAGMHLHPQKTRIINTTTDSITYLGHTFEPDHTIRPSNENINTFKNRVQNITNRRSGRGRRAKWITAEVLKEVNNLTTSWRAYYVLCHEHTLRLLNKWLRSHILRKLQHHAVRNGTPQHSVGLKRLVSLVATSDRKVGAPSTFPERRGSGSESADSSDLDGNKKLQLKPMEVKHA